MMGVPAASVTEALGGAVAGVAAAGRFSRCLLSGETGACVAAGTPLGSSGRSGRPRLALNNSGSLKMICDTSEILKVSTLPWTRKSTTFASACTSFPENSRPSFKIIVSASALHAHNRIRQAVEINDLGFTRHLQVLPIV